MDAKSFPECNITLKGDGCLDLPAMTNGNEFVSCWTPTIDELKYIVDCIKNKTVPEFYLAITGSSHPPVFVGAGRDSVFERVEPEKTEEKENGTEDNAM